MTRRETILLWCVLLVGLLARLVWDFSSTGVHYDIESFGLVAQAWDQHHLSFYAAVNEGTLVPRWPYPPGFLGWIEVTQRLDRVAGLPFDDVIQIPSIVADIAIAWLVQYHLGWRGESSRVRLAAAATVALGPSFAFVSGYHGQIDSAAILPAVGALVIWERSDSSSRALWAGLLIGAGGAVKTVPLFMVLALLPTARSWRERTQLVGAAALVPLVLLAPFLAADFGGVVDSLSYNGRPGLGGLSLVLQPSLVDQWFSGQHFHYSAASGWLKANGGFITLSAVVLAGAAAYVRRLRPAEAASVIWLTVFVLGANYFPWYVVWGLPFFVLVSVRAAIVVQLALLPPTMLTYVASGWIGRPDLVYMPVMLAVWLMFVAAIAWLLYAGPAARTPVRAD